MPLTNSHPPRMLILTGLIISDEKVYKLETACDNYPWTSLMDMVLTEKNPLSDVHLVEYPTAVFNDGKDGYCIDVKD